MRCCTSSFIAPGVTPLWQKSCQLTSGLHFLPSFSWYFLSRVNNGALCEIAYGHFSWNQYCVILQKNCNSWSQLSSQSLKQGVKGDQELEDLNPNSTFPSSFWKENQTRLKKQNHIFVFGHKQHLLALPFYFNFPFSEFFSSCCLLFLPDMLLFFLN